MYTFTKDQIPLQNFITEPLKHRKQESDITIFTIQKDHYYVLKQQLGRETRSKVKKKKRVKSSYYGLWEKTKMGTRLKQWQQEKIIQNERTVKIIYNIVTVADIVSCLHDSHPFNWFPCKKSLLLGTGWKYQIIVFLTFNYRFDLIPSQPMESNGKSPCICL